MTENRGQSFEFGNRNAEFGKKDRGWGRKTEDRGIRFRNSEWGMRNETKRSWEAEKLKAESSEKMRLARIEIVKAERRSIGHGAEGV